MNDALEEVDTPEKHIERIDGWIRALTNEAHFQDERVHLLKPLVLDTEVQIAMKAKLDKTRGVALWNHLAPLLGQDYIRDLARLFLDKGGKTGSLTNIWKKLQMPGMRAHYRESYSRMFDELQADPIEGISAATVDAWRQRDRDENAAQFDEKWAGFAQAMADLDDDPLALKIKTFRDKHHSHMEMQPMVQEPKPFDIATLGLTFNEVFSFGRRCQQLLADLGVLLTHTHWEPDQFSDISAESGRALWMTLAK